MHIVVGLLSAKYSGRGESLLAPYPRIAILKQDGSISIHGEKGFKPMNYMTSTTSMEVTEEAGERIWSFDNGKETLVITFHKIFDEIDLELGTDDPGHIKGATESQLQEWLSNHMELIGPGVRFVEREHQTGDGPVDILGVFPDGGLAVVEVKRVAPINTVGQVVRYLDAMRERNPLHPCVGVIAAVEFKAKTRVLAEKKAILCVDIPEDWFSQSEEEKAKAPPMKDLFSLLGEPSLTDKTT